jgi:general transcription factor IIIA
MSDVDKEEAERIARHPFPCTHQGCSRRFATNSKRNAHARGHEDKTKYMCALQHAPEGGSGLYFATWTELRQHQRDCHPPTCSWPGCSKTFANLQNLRQHMYRHEEKESGARTSREDEEGSDVSSEDDDQGQAKAQKATFGCSWTPTEGVAPACSKVFRSKYARDNHVKNRHLGLKEYICRHAECLKRYGNKRSLNRHTAKCHNARGDRQSGDDETDEEVKAEMALDDDFFREEGGAVPELFSERQPAQKRARESDGTAFGGLLSSLTGSGYGEARVSKKRKMRGRVVSCPWHKICLLRDAEASNSCSFRFSRLYDVQRHLESTHRIPLSQVEILSLLEEEEGSRLATPRPSASGNRESSVGSESGGDE